MAIVAKEDSYWSIRKNRSNEDGHAIERKKMTYVILELQQEESGATVGVQLKNQRPTGGNLNA